MLKTWRAAIAALLALAATPALAQTVGGGSHVYQDWYPTAPALSETAGNVSANVAYPSQAQTAFVCNNDSTLLIYVNPFGRDNTVTASAASFPVKPSTCRAFNLNPYNSQFTWIAYYAPSGSPSLTIETGVGSPLASYKYFPPPGSGVPGGTNPQIQYNAGAGLFGGFTMTGDCNLTAMPILECPVIIKPLNEYGVTPASTSSQVSTAVAAAAADCNSGAIQGFSYGPGNWNHASDPPIFLAPCFVGGAGPTTTLVAPSGSALLHWFQWGNDSTRVSGGGIANLTIKQNQFVGTQNDYCELYAYSATDLYIQNVRFIGGTDPFCAGSATETNLPSRIYATGLTGDLNNGLNNAANFNLIAGTSIYLDGTFNGSGASNTNATGCLISMVPSDATHFLDTVSLNLRLQSFGSQVAKDGKPYYLCVDTSLGKVDNLTVPPTAYGDHTTVAGVYYHSAGNASSKDNIHVHRLTPLRITPDAGAAIVIAMCDGARGSGLVIDTRVLDRDGTTPIQILGPTDGCTTTNYDQMQLNAIVEDTIGTAPSTPACAMIHADGWFVGHFKCGPFGAATTGFQYQFDLNDTSLSNITIQCALEATNGNSSPLVPKFALEPAYSNLDDPGRQICRPKKFDVLASGTSLTSDLSDGFDHIAEFRSATTSAKTWSVTGCSAAYDHRKVTVRDEQRTAATYNITGTPTAGTVMGSSSILGNANGFSYDLECVGASTDFVLN